MKILFRLFAPMLVQQVVKKAGQAFYEQQQNAQQQYQQPHTNAQEKPREKKKVGEYIDFEELD